MYIEKSVYIVGDVSFQYSAGLDRDYQDIKSISQDDIELIDAGLDESFWEAINADCPEEEVFCSLKETAQYSNLLLLSDEELEQAITKYVNETLVSTEAVTSVDGVDKTNIFGNCRGQHDYIFEYIVDGVVHLVLEDIDRIQSEEE